MAVRRCFKLLAGLVAVVAAFSGSRADAQNWDGSGLVRFGVYLQGSAVDFDIRQSPLVGAAFSQSAKPDGWGVGISAGYDLRLGSFVIGGEADISFDDGKDKASPFTRESFGIDYFSTIRGRLGYLIHPAFLVYGTAGYSLLGTEYKLDGLNNTVTGAKKFGTLDGFVYGGGIEYDMGWGIGFFEYLHSDISGWSFRGFTGNNVSVDGSQDVFRLGLKFKVGHDFSHDVYRRPEPLK